MKVGHQKQNMKVANKVGHAKEILSRVIEKMNTIEKAQAVFITNIAGKDVDWEMSFQFNLSNENPFFIEIKNHKIILSEGTKSDAIIILSGNPDAIMRICEGKGDFTHAISREHITVEKGKVMDVIRFTRAITIVLKNK
ncbi:MAG: SCP2 sterol-binding domain-containing protein [Promethearchaeota archaeon]